MLKTALQHLGGYQTTMRSYLFMGLGLMRAARYLPPESVYRCPCLSRVARDKSPFEPCVENRHLDVHQLIQPKALRAATTPPPRTRSEDVREAGRIDPTQSPVHLTPQTPPSGVNAGVRLAASAAATMRAALVRARVRVSQGEGEG